MKRREFVKKAGATGMLMGAAIASGCKSQSDGQPTVQRSDKVYQWKMVTTWPKNFPGLGTGANYLINQIEKMSHGQIKIKLYGAGDLVPAFEVFDTVSQGTVEMGHGAAYYWKGKDPAMQFFGAVPFGMNADEMNAWLYHGGGMELWTEAYAPFNLVPFAAGNTGVQMGGWFNKEIHTIDDLKGLKMRIPGLGGEVFKRAGGVPVTLSGAEVFTSLQSGAIDATEWVGPYNDLVFGLYQAAKYYYYPGWHEPTAVLECMVNKDAYNELPDYLQAIVSQAAKAANIDMLSEYMSANQKALETLVIEHGVQLRRFPDAVLAHLHEISETAIEELAATSELARRIYDSYTSFHDNAKSWDDISNYSYSQTRNL